MRALVGEVGRPLNLAVLRITVAIAIVTSDGIREAARWSTLPPELRDPTAWRGLEPLVAALPLDVPLVRVLQIATVLAAAFAVLGIRPRLAMAVLAGCAFVLFGAQELHGAALHQHHPVWLALLLAASPCGDALTLRDPPRRRAPAAYAVPLLAAWILVGFVYLFPGIWKLRTSGLDWIFSDNLQNQLRWKWAQRAEVPSFRLDRYPVLCQLGALAVVVFELGFLPLVLWRRTRAIAVWSALVFHALTARLLHVYFFSLFACFTMFVDWERVLESAAVWLFDARERPRPLWWPRQVREESTPAVGASIAMAAILVAGNATAGILGIPSAWPFACYPTFEHRAGPEMPVLVVEAVRQSDAVPLPQPPSPRVLAIAWQLVLSEEPPAPERLRAYWELARPAVLPDGTVAVRFTRAVVAVDPDVHAPPRRLGELGTITP
jgi:vitamin K-dependent gamma-carboxylase-like protein